MPEQQGPIAICNLQAFAFCPACESVSVRVCHRAKFPIVLGKALLLADKLTEFGPAKEIEVQVGLPQLRLWCSRPCMPCCICAHHAALCRVVVECVHFSHFSSAMHVVHGAST